MGQDTLPSRSSSSESFEETASDVVKSKARNLGVDYVISFRFKTTSKLSLTCIPVFIPSTDLPRYTDQKQAEAQLERLVHSLDRVGLRVEAREGRNGSVLVFVRIKSQRKFMAEVYRSRYVSTLVDGSKSGLTKMWIRRVKDWLHGIRPEAPGKETQKSLDLESVKDAERLRLVYLLITLPPGEGGAGITPKQGEWDMVESIFTLHDRQFEKVYFRGVSCV